MARGGHHYDTDVPTHDRVGHGGNPDPEDARCAGEDTFHLNALEGLSAARDHVLRPVDEADEPLRPNDCR